MKPGSGSNRDRKVALMRKAKTAAETSYGIGGRLKARPRPIVSLPKINGFEAKDK